MAIKFSQFNLRTDHTDGMYLVGYDGNQNIHITVDNLFDDFINGTENTLAMFGSEANTVVDSIVTQHLGNTGIEIDGFLTVENDISSNGDLTIFGGSATFNGDVNLGNASTNLITQTGTLYLNGPVKDTTNTLGTADQVLLSDATGELTFTDVYDLNIGSAETVSVPVKNVQGSALVKGDPVYISGSVGASGRLEVQLADASNALKMPAVGLLKQDLANNAEGFAVVTGKLRNLITDPIDGVTPVENDVIYVKPSGTSGAALTTTKPVYDNFIQNMGKVGRVSGGNSGTFVVSSILRTNDIPNLSPGRLWVGSSGNTIESLTVFVNETARTVGINTTNPQHALTVDGSIGISDFIEHNNDSNTKFGFSGNDTFVVQTSGTERLKVSVGGNIGINTSSPQRTLDVNGVILSSNRSGQAFRAEPSTGSGFAVTEFFNNNPILRLAKDTGQDTVKIQALGDSFLNGGKVGIGNSGSSAQLDVATSGNFPAAKITTTHSSGTGLVVQKTSSGTGDMQRWQYTNNTVKAVVDSEGKFGIGLTNPLFDLDVYGSKGLRTRRSTATDGFALVALNSLSTPTSACGIYYTNNVGSLILNDTTQSQNVKIQALGDSYIKGGRLGIGNDLTTARPDSILFVKNGDIEIERPTTGSYGGRLILETPNKTANYAISVDNNGDIISTGLQSGSVRPNVTSIVAGTNVTISPASGTGAVTINASGGGGGGGATSLNGLTDALTTAGGASLKTQNLILGQVALNLPNLNTTNSLGANVILQPTEFGNPTNLTTAFRNFAAIEGAGRALTTGYENIAIGVDALSSATTGARYVAIGNMALSSSNESGQTYNVAIGDQSGINSQAGKRNTFIGGLSGFSSGSTSGDNITTIGFGARASSSTAFDEVTLGNGNVNALRCNVTSITSLSDERDKKDITDLEYGLEFIESLQPKQFTWDNRTETFETTDSEGNNITEEITSSNKGKKDFGFIAQEVQPLDNEVLRLVYDENPDKLEMSYGKLVPILVKAVKELSDKVKALENA